MNIKLYVDVFYENDTLAITSTQDSLDYNSIAMQVSGITFTSVFSAGRYLCIIKGADEKEMLFMDIRTNPGLAKTILNDPDFDNSLKQTYASLIEVYNSIYDAHQNDVELILGYPPKL